MYEPIFKIDYTDEELIELRKPLGITYKEGSWEYNREKETGKKYIPSVYFEYSLQACRYPLGSPAWYERDTRSTFKQRGSGSK